jgi:hypothetical protein
VNTARQPEKRAKRSTFPLNTELTIERRRNYFESMKILSQKLEMNHFERSERGYVVCLEE